MSASMKHRGSSRQNDRKSHKNKTDRRQDKHDKGNIKAEKVVTENREMSGRSVRHPWTPSTQTAFKALLSARLCAAIWSHITDCDETFNYWEPLHYVMHGRGFQTWEYSPVYAIRSYAYLWLYALPLKLYSCLLTLSQGNRMLEFYFLRTVMGFSCVLCEIFLYRSVCQRYGNNVGRLLLCFLLLSTGMFISSTAFLPSSFSMYMVFLAMAAWIAKMYSVAVFGIAAGAILGWPFTAALGIPLAYDVLIRQRKISGFILWSGISAIICLVPLVLIDSYYYGKLVVAPLNIIMYNVFSEHGPDIYGVEPWSFYFVNGFLNFNFVFLVSLVAVPIVMGINILLKLLGHNVSNKTVLPVWLCLGPLYIWIIIFFTRPHKEERFLYPIYPLFCLGAALALDHVQKFLHTVLSSTKSAPVHYTRNKLGQVMVITFCVVFSVLSLSRSYALYRGYHAPLDVYSDLSHLTYNTDTHDLPDTRQVTVCVGKEWYRFPSSFFLPSDRWKLQFIKSQFRGQLPKPYETGPDATRIIPDHMNDMNLEEVSRYQVNISQCHYLVDLDLPIEAEFEPRYSQMTDDWKVVATSYFLDTQRSHPIYRAFYIPGLSNTHNIYVKYHLLQSKRYKKIKT